MNSKIALTAALWLAMAGTAVATALPETPTLKYPSFPEYPIDDTEARLQHLEMLVTKQQLVIQSLRNDLSNMVAINDYVTLETVHGRPTVRFNAINLQVVNGTGETEVANGVGNIVIGYDQLRDDTYDAFDDECSIGGGPNNQPTETQAECVAMGGTWGLDHKAGSHNLVVGDEHNYGRWAGIVSGWANTANGRYASVTGGYYNRASAVGASVNGGAFNVALGGVSTISGGHNNTTTGSYSSVTGGWGNVASGSSSSVTGGGFNEATAIISTVSGGTENKASADGTSVSGGTLNEASGYRSSVSGGNRRTATGTFDWAGGTY